MFKWILSFLGGGPLNKLIDGLNKAYSDKLNSKNETEKTEANERIEYYKVLLADTTSARQNSANLPWWMATMAFLFGIGFALHTFFIAMGTAFQPLIINGWFDWWLHIPKLPSPYDTSEIGIIGFFFGSAAVLGGTTAIAKAISSKK